MNILETLASRQETLTQQEVRIFRLMQKDVKSFALSSIGEIAELLGISKTTLMRFAKSSGFKGYADFKKQLQREVLLTSSPAGKMRDLIESDYSLSMEELCKREQANIAESFESFDAQSLQTAVDLILEAKEIHTLSWGISGHLAEMFAVRTRLIGIRCNMIKRHLGTLLEESAHLGKDDLVVLFEFPPYSREIIETIEELRKRNVRIILVTDSRQCPAARITNLAFYCVTDTLFFGNSFVAPLFWVNLITSLVMDSNREKAMSALSKQQNIFNKKQYYHQLP